MRRGSDAGNSRLQGRVALVTGGGSGIGDAACRELAREGAAVVISDVNQEAGNRVVGEIEAAGGRAVFVRCDVSREDDVAAAVARAEEEYGGLDVLFANAGIGETAPAVDLSLDDWQRTIRVNLTGGVPVGEARHAVHAAPGRGRHRLQRLHPGRGGHGRDGGLLGD